MSFQPRFLITFRGFLSLKTILFVLAALCFQVGWNHPVPDTGWGWLEPVNSFASEELKAGDLYAVVVGISRYRDPKIPALKVSDNDAKSIAEFLKTQKNLFKEIHVSLLVNEKATREALETELYYKIRRAGKDDTVIIFLSGHGSDDPKNPGEFFFLPYDANAEFVAVGGIHMNRQWFVDKLDSKRVLIIADACHAGGFTGSGMKRLPPSLDKFMGQFKQSEGRVFITSSRADEISREAPEHGHSLFTHYMLEGLSGKAADQAGVVNLKSLYDYVYKMTKKASDGFQSPQMEGKVVGSFPVAWVSERKEPIRQARPPERAPLSVEPSTSAEPGLIPPDYAELRRFRQILEIVRKNYVVEVDDARLIRGSLTGMLESLDPHSSFLTEEMFRERQTETLSEFGGLGIEITLDSGVLTVVSPIEDTPAFKSGIKPGDKIVKINGESTKNITLQRAVEQMRGPKGTKATITIMREGWTKFKDFTLTRQVITIQSVQKATLEPGYQYIRLANFQEVTDSDLIQAIEEMGGDDKIKGMVLDLRNNPGGLLDQAVKVANLFLTKGVIVYTEGRVQDQLMQFMVSQTGKHYNFRLSILVNQGTAGETEVVAGALQDHDRSLVFGSKTFGKGSMQTIIPLERGLGMSLTTAFYFTPKGRALQKAGILPDVDLTDAMLQEMKIIEMATVP